MLPLFENNRLNHIQLRRVETDSSRHKNKVVVNHPPRNNTQYGEGLNQRIEVVIRSFQETVATQPPEFDPAFIFKVRVEGAVSEENWRGSNLTVLSEEADGVTILFSPDQLEEFRNHIGAYTEPIAEGKKNPRYAWIASVTEEIELWNHQNRIGRKLRHATINPDQEYYFDVELWVYGSAEENQSRLAALEQFVTEHGGRVTDRYRGTDLYLARVRILGFVLDQMLEIGNIREIDLPPEPAMEMPQYRRTSLDDFPTPVNPPDHDSPGICVIDSGLATGHPYLRAAVGDARSFPATLGTEIDQNNHGTMVSGLALYGNIEACIDNLDFNPQIFLYSARVTNAQNHFDDESLIITQMEQAIQYFYETYHCRVFNISLADPDLVYADGKPSPWASTLDNLAHLYNVVIVVSTGNIPVISYRGADAESVRVNYPRYLLENSSRILEPSTAVNVLTVGSICQSDQSVYAGRQPGDLIEPIGEINLPAPFTRSGPGVNGAVKPDIVEYGGNCVLYTSQRRFLTNDPGLDIVSTNRNYQNNLFAAMSGTSFSAPKVAHLAGIILKKYPDISANMVRALIASSAEIPKIAKERSLSDEDIKRLYGYGLPNEERALFSTDSRVLLMADDEIATDNIHIYEIPIPDVFRVTRGERQITICLAYDPPVKHTRKDYVGVNLEFRLIRGKTTEEIYNWYSSQRVDGAIKIPDCYNCDLQPSIKKRGGGTLHKAVFLIRQNTAFERYPGEICHLLIQSKKGWALPDLYPTQRYAVTVSLEHLGVQLDIYNSLRSRIRQDVRDRARVRA